MHPLQLILGMAAYGLAVKMKKPIRKAAVVAASQVLGVVDSFKAAAYEVKEEIEDIVAEAQYENMKRNLSSIQGEDDLTENEDHREGGK